MAPEKMPPSTPGAAASVATTPRRRSSRLISQRKGPSPTIRGLPITAFRPPWVQHYIDIGHCRLTKCTKRINKATASDIHHLSVSFLAMAIKASTASGPKARQEQALMDYTNAVIARGIPPNDHDERLGSAVSMAAYFGYVKLLKLLLDAGCPITNDGKPHALRAAVKNAKHVCIRLFLKERPEETRAQLHKETLASWLATTPTTMEEAIFQGDVEAVRLLQQQNAMLLILVKNSNIKKWTTLLNMLYPDIQNVVHWSKELHWSFPGADRRMLNWLWYALKRQREQIDDNKNNHLSHLPSDVWLRVFGFIGRRWWSVWTLVDQNGLKDTMKN